MTGQVPSCTRGHFPFAHYSERDMTVVADKSALIGKCPTRDPTSRASLQRGPPLSELVWGKRSIASRAPRRPGSTAAEYQVALGLLRAELRSLALDVTQPHSGHRVP